MKSIFNRFWDDESGATSIEYALIAAVIGIGVLAGFTSLKQAINDKYNTLSTDLTAAK
jgi:pilus assembly protein Flp/PilA